MFQQNSIVVGKPHMKPVVLKPSPADEPLADEDAVLSLEYFAGYELELQETILQLNSELEGSFSSEEEEEEEDSLDQHVAETSLADSLSCSEADSVEEAPLGEATLGQLESPEDPAQEAMNQRVVLSSTNGCAYEFDDYELLLQKAVHDLASLSDVLVGYRYA